MPKPIALLLALAALSVTFLAAPAMAGAKTIRVGDNWFVRDTSGAPSVTVASGTAVLWRWVGRAPHNVVVLRGPKRFSSAIKTKGTFRKTLRTRGTYTIYCTIHGVEDMSMKLKVR